MKKECPFCEVLIEIPDNIAALECPNCRKTIIPKLPKNVHIEVEKRLRAQPSSSLKENQNSLSTKEEPK